MLNISFDLQISLFQINLENQETKNFFIIECFVRSMNMNVAVQENFRLGKNSQYFF